MARKECEGTRIISSSSMNVKYNENCYYPYQNTHPSVTEDPFHRLGNCCTLFPDLL